MKKISLVLVFVLSACQNNPPPTLSPIATLAWQKTRVIKALDVLRDTTIDAEAQVPPLVSTDDARKVIQAHESILKVMDSSDWATFAQGTLAELMKNLPTQTQVLLSPYLALTNTLISIGMEMMK